MKLEIRLERPEEWRQVEELTREAFWNVHVPGCDEHYLVHVLRGLDSFIPALDFVALSEGRIVGNIMYSMGRVEEESGRKKEVILFGPLSVLPSFQGKGVGGALIRHSAAVARELGYAAILIYGDPMYYARFGFRAASEYGITPPDGKPHPALQALELFEGALSGVSGKFYEDNAFDVDKKAAEAYDMGFPIKEKGYAPSQDRFRTLSGGEGV